MIYQHRVDNVQCWRFVKQSTFLSRAISNVPMFCGDHVTWKDYNITCVRSLTKIKYLLYKIITKITQTRSIDCQYLHTLQLNSNHHKQPPCLFHKQPGQMRTTNVLFPPKKKIYLILFCCLVLLNCWAGAWADGTKGGPLLTSFPWMREKPLCERRLWVGICVERFFIFIMAVMSTCA